jgi:hypothetical protein
VVDEDGVLRTVVASDLVFGSAVSLKVTPLKVGCQGNDGFVIKV